MNSKILLGLYKLTRVNEFYGNTVALSAFGLALNNLLTPLDFILITLGNLSMTIFSFAINDIEDADDDAKDPKKVNRNPISAKIIKKNTAYLFTALFAIFPLIIFQSYGNTTLILASTTLIIGFLYSYKQVRLKSMPVLDLISHGLFLGTLEFLISATAYNNSMTPEILAMGVCIFIMSVAGDLGNEIRDHEVDRKTGIKNTAAYINITKVGKWLEWMYIPPSIIAAYIISLQFESIEKLAIILLSLFVLIYYLTLKKDVHNITIGSISQNLLVFIGGAIVISQFFI